MNLKPTVLPLLFSLLLLVRSLGSPDGGDPVQDDFRTVIAANMKLAGTEIDRLYQTALSYRYGQSSIEQLRAQLSIARNAYKKNEAVLEYYYPEHCKAYLNGAPLDHPDPLPIEKLAANEQYYILSPEEYARSLPLDELEAGHYKGKRKIVAAVGLQVLDEIVFSGQAQKQKEALVTLCDDLRQSFKTANTALARRNYFYDFEIAEAARLELVRIFSMGLTGFDTPGSLNAVQESNSALRGVSAIMEPLLSKAADRQKADALFASAGKFLDTHRDFNTFDRLHFLTAYLNPLYRELLVLQKGLGIKSSAETFNDTPSWNAYSENLFAPDFLNPYYYAILKKDKDSEALRSLGKKLFNDGSLSQNGRMSCASCHSPAKAFSDGEPKSMASVNGKRVLRNSPSLINSVFSDRYFYDLRAFDLEEQAAHVVQSHEEFNTDFAEIVRKLQQDAAYRKSFSDIFKTEAITRYQFSAALASYVLSLRSFNSPFDRFARGQSKNLSPEARAGFNLFMGKAACATCHFAPTFSGLVPPLYRENESEVLGVFEKPNSLTVDADRGRIANQLENDDERIYERSFKTSSVRNAALTAPYFHNGAYRTLEEVLDFYDRGGAGGAGLSYEVPNQTLPPDALNLSKKEKAAIIAFIRSLSDNPFAE